jgi:hypothetical protein
MRKVGVIVLVAFAVTLAVVVGGRMSTDAMAVVVGVVCGVAAGIPMSVLLMLALRRRDRESEESLRTQTDARYAAPAPPVVVIQGGTPAASNLPPPYYPMHAAMAEPVHRQFRVIGEDEE